MRCGSVWQSYDRTSWGAKINEPLRRMKGVTQQNEDQTDSNHAQMEHANTE